jgi:hypothetical protein
MCRKDTRSFCEKASGKPRNIYEYNIKRGLGEIHGLPKKKTLQNISSIVKSFTKYTGCYNAYAILFTADS